MHDVYPWTTPRWKSPARMTATRPGAKPKHCLACFQPPFWYMWYHHNEAETGTYPTSL
jgi:hypothetical protein